MGWLTAKPWGPRASAGSLMGRVRVLETPGLLSLHWWVKPGPGVGAGLLVGRASLESDCRAQGALRGCWIAGVWGPVTAQLGAGSGVSC